MSGLRSIGGALLGLLLLTNCSAPPVALSPTPQAPAPRDVGPPAALKAPVPVVAEPPAVVIAPVPTPPVGAFGWRDGDIIVFEAALHGEGQRDLYLFNARFDTVWAIVEANTEFDEANPKLSRDRNWLIFRRALPHPERGQDQNLLLLDMNSGLLNTLPGVNTGDFNEIMPAISDEGRYILYVSDRDRFDRLHLYDVWTHTDYDIPVANRDVFRIGDLAFGDEGRLAIFSASFLDWKGEETDLDIFVYDFMRGMRWLAPFVQSRFNEDDPELSLDGRHLLFASDRRGSWDIYEADLQTGYIDDLVLANTPDAIENSPKFYGPNNAYIRFKFFPVGATDPNYFQVRAFDPLSGALDTLPVANRNFLPLP